MEKKMKVKLIDTETGKALVEEEASLTTSTTAMILWDVDYFWATLERQGKLLHGVFCNDTKGYYFKPDGHGVARDEGTDTIIIQGGDKITLDAKPF